MKRLPNLDVLRFVLAFLVVIFHVPQLCRNQGLPYYDELPIFHKGIEAVYVFFVLSGYLIIRLIYLEKLQGIFSIKRFYMRRVLRIFPLYYLVVIFGFFFYNFLLPYLQIDHDTNYTLIQGIGLTFFFLPNVFSALYEPGGILEILWSIGIEEQFYLIIAPLLFTLPVKRTTVFLVILLFGYFIIFHLDGMEFMRQFKMVFFFLFFGGIVALLEENKKLEILKKNPIFPFAVVLLFLLYFTTDLFEFESKWLSHLSAMLLFGFFIHTLSSNFKGIAIKNKMLNHFGAISYGIYMYHIIALNVVVFIALKFKDVDIINDNLMIILINIFTFALTLIMAHISYIYYESYFLKLKRKFRK